MIKRNFMTSNTYWLWAASLVYVAGQTGIPQQRPHDWCRSWPRLHSEQKDQKCTIGAVQLHPGLVATHFLHFSVIFIYFSLSIYIMIYFQSLHVSLLGTVVGEKEKTSNTVNVRTRDNKVHGERSVNECIERLKQLKASRSRNAEEEFWAFSNVLLSACPSHNSTSSLVTLKGHVVGISF